MTDNCWDSDYSNNRSQESGNQNFYLAPIHRFTHMNDQSNAQTFTFLLLPHFICGLVDYVESPPFVYSEHVWSVRFERNDSHMSAYLKLNSLYSRSCNKHKTQPKRTNRTDLRPSPWEYVILDMEFMIKNREDFSLNECFSKLAVSFNSGQTTQGRKNFVDLTMLSAKRFLFDDGKLIVELSLRNPRIGFNLQAMACKDPTVRTSQHQLHMNSSVLIRRLDNSFVTIPNSMHFETDEFTVGLENWSLVVDIEPFQKSSSTNSNYTTIPQSPPATTTATTDNSDICAKVELCLIRKDLRGYLDDLYKSERTSSYWMRVSCNITFPGDCMTGPIEFLIGSQGWPMQSYSCTFGLEVNSESGLGSGTTNCTNSHDNNQPNSRTQHGGSVVALLLHSLTSPLNISLEDMKISRLSYVDVPIQPDSNRPCIGPIIPDPYGSQWIVYLNNRTRLIRIGLFKDDGSKQTKSHTVKVNPNPNKDLIVPRGYARLVGCRLRIKTSNGQKRSFIDSVGKQILQIIHTHTDFEMNPIQNSDKCPPLGGLTDVNLLLNSATGYNLSSAKLRESDLHIFTGIGQHRRFRRPLNSTGSDSGDERLYDKSKCLVRFSKKVEQFSNGQVAMDITTHEASDPSQGVINASNGKISIEINWIYSHLLFIGEYYQSDEITARQFHQMRTEFNRLLKERDELERQLMVNQLGLVQIDPNNQGPKSLVPIDSLTSALNQAERRINSSDDRYSEIGYSKSSVEQWRKGSQRPLADQPIRTSHKSLLDDRYEQQQQQRQQHQQQQQQHQQLQQLQAQQKRSTNRYHYSDSSQRYGDIPDDFYTFRDGRPKTYSVDYDYEDPLSESCITGPIHPSSSQSMLSTNSSLPERRSQFGRSKATWKTYEAGHQSHNFITPPSEPNPVVQRKQESTSRNRFMGGSPRTAINYSVEDVSWKPYSARNPNYTRHNYPR